MPYVLESLLTGQTLAEFLACTWQKAPRRYRPEMLLPALSLEDVLHLALRDETGARLLVWGEDVQVQDGPFDKRHLHHIKERAGLQLLNAEWFEPQLAGLWQAFAPLSFARLAGMELRWLWPGARWPDELNSGDQFIVQLQGTSRWRHVRDAQWPYLPPNPTAPLELAMQDPQELQGGEMLYLPAGCWFRLDATSSGLMVLIRGRAISDRELVEEFLRFLMQRPQPVRVLQHMAPTPQNQPAAIPDSWLAQLQEVLNGIRWSRDELQEFVGLYLSRPDSPTFFEAPRHPLGPDAFAARLEKQAVVLAPAVRLLYRGDCFYCNGESFRAEDGAAEAFRRLADQRSLPAGCHAAELQAWLYEAYTLGLVYLVAA